MSRAALDRRLIVKTLVILAISLSCLYAILAHNIRLGLDLRGGASLILEVELQDAFNAEAAAAADRLKYELGRAHVPFGPVQVTEAKGLSDLERVRIEVAGVAASDTGKFRLVAEEQLPRWAIESGTTGSLRMTLTPAEAAVLRRDVFEQARLVLERRVNAYGLSETPVIPYGSRGSELLIQLPGVTDPAHVKQLLATRAVLEWVSVAGGPYADREDALARHGGVLPLGARLMPFAPAGEHRSGGWYLVTGTPVIRGSDLRDARVAINESGQAVTTFTLSQESARRFERYTQANIGRLAAIVLDNRLLSVAVVEDVIRDAGQIRGLTREEAQDLALNLRAGALPAGITVLQESTIEPSLGSDSIQHGLRAGGVGLAAVVLAMLLYYRRVGVNATLALLLNGLLLLAGLSCLDAVLTLPGIAGVILTLGMAVDSNVLIFERIREQLRAGKAPPVAIAAGFTRAFGTLIDTHVTTVVSCAFLFLFGTQAVKGFAITLVLGLVTNLFTSVFVSRVVFDWELRQRSLSFRI
jgi:preprotein translocase subunit SecD